ncbi:MAG TPA: hypothetical protein VFO59_01930 [Dehalococcoidia bacterium]|nr:hypothetical protein [Dehalococcoidia bacterium]
MRGVGAGVGVAAAGVVHPATVGDGGASRLTRNAEAVFEGGGGTCL